MKSRLYTRTGDDGTTSLVGGARARKDSLRLEAYGTLDELNSWIGLVASEMPGDDEFKSSLPRIQSRLFEIGTLLATPAESSWQPEPFADEALEELEALVDRVDGRLKPLRSFILPGGEKGASLAHVARTVARRAERRIVALGSDVNIDPLILPYINRLSDFLFALARYINHAAGVEDVPVRP